ELTLRGVGGRNGDLSLKLKSGPLRRGQGAPTELAGERLRIDLHVELFVTGCTWFHPLVNSKALTVDDGDAPFRCQLLVVIVFKAGRKIDKAALVRIRDAEKFV